MAANSQRLPFSQLDARHHRVERRARFDDVAEAHFLSARGDARVRGDGPGAAKSTLLSACARCVTASELLNSHRCVCGSAKACARSSSSAGENCGAARRYAVTALTFAPRLCSFSASHSRPPSPRTISTLAPRQSWPSRRCHSASESNCAASAAGSAMRSAGTPWASSARVVPGPVHATCRSFGQGRPAGFNAKKCSTAFGLTNTTRRNCAMRAHASTTATDSDAG